MSTRQQIAAEFTSKPLLLAAVVFIVGIITLS
jgi:hypothetical protein